MSTAIMDRLTEHDQVIRGHALDAAKARDAGKQSVRVLETAEGKRLAYYRDLALGTREEDEAIEAELIGAVNSARARLIEGNGGRLYDPRARAKAEAADARKAEAEADRLRFVRDHSAAIEAAVLAEAEAVAEQVRAAHDALAAADAAWRDVGRRWHAVGEGIGLDPRSPMSVTPAPVTGDGLKVLSIDLRRRSEAPIPAGIVIRREQPEPAAVG